jgi:predicted KAP-like P-loop ATPase
MWDDIETTHDLLNFKVIADTAARMIEDVKGEPVSIGISGSWGSGKSSLVQMIGASLKNLDGGENTSLSILTLGYIKGMMTHEWLYSKKLLTKYWRNRSREKLVLTKPKSSSGVLTG